MKFKSIRKNELIWLIISVITLGFCQSFLNPVAFGIDPCTTVNLGISKLIGMSLGNWQALFNCVLFILVFLFAKEQIGWGTLANMFLVGYSFDFFSWVNGKLLPADFYQNITTRILVTIPALALFILAASVYIGIQQGTAPYDALPYIIAKKLPKVPFKIVRMGWDISYCIVGFLLGETVGVVTLIMAFALGPAISYAEKHIVSRLIPKDALEP